MELSPLYKVPSRNTIKSMIFKKFNVLAEVVKKELEGATDITLTSDIWTETMSMKSFLGLNVYFLKGTELISLSIETVEMFEAHTSQYISTILVDVMAKWHIDQEKVVAVVTDNDAKMIKAVQLIFGNNRHISCFAHTLNLTVENSLKSGIEDLISKVRNIVLFFKRSTKSSDELRQKQKEKGKKAGEMKKLILDVKTRWNSTFYMIDRFLELLALVNDILLTKPTSPPTLSALAIETLKEITNILKIFEKLTVEASGQKYVTISKIIPMVNCLKKSFHKIEVHSEAVGKLKTALNAEIEKRFGKFESAHLLSLSTILDPRFKAIHHCDLPALGKTNVYLSRIIDENIRRQNLLLQEKSVDAEENMENPETEIWGIHKQLATKKNNQVMQKECSKLSLYLSNPVADLKENPLEIWENTKHVYPILYLLARKYLSPVGTSERLFSRAGLTITQQKNRLSGDASSYLIFLGSLPCYWG